MTREETAQIMRVLQLAYPGFYSKYRAKDFADIIALWSTIFADDNAQVVTAAVRDLIQTHTGFPPEIADVRKKIKELVDAATGEPTDEDYWIMLRSALADGTWGASEQFDRLPAPLKRYCGSASWLRDHARMDADVIDSVVHGQFLKQFPRVKQAEEYRESLPGPLRDVIGALFGKIPDAAGPTEINDGRNAVLAKLERGTAG